MYVINGPQQFVNSCSNSCSMEENWRSDCFTKFVPMEITYWDLIEYSTVERPLFEDVEEGNVSNKWRGAYQCPVNRGDFR